MLSPHISLVVGLLSTVLIVTTQSFTVKIESHTIHPGSHGVKSALGEVYGTRACDGAGHLVQWRVEGCDESSFSPCKFPANETIRRSEVDFIPSADIEQLGLRLIITVQGKQPKVVYDNPVLNTTVKAGQQYTSKAAGGVSKELQGKMITSQYILYRADTEEKTTEICAEADFEMA